MAAASVPDPQACTMVGLRGPPSWRWVEGQLSSCPPAAFHRSAVNCRPPHCLARGGAWKSALWRSASPPALHPGCPLNGMKEKDFCPPPSLRLPFGLLFCRTFPSMKTVPQK